MNRLKVSSTFVVLSSDTQDKTAGLQGILTVDNSISCTILDSLMVYHLLKM